MGKEKEKKGQGRWKGGERKEQDLSHEVGGRERGAGKKGGKKEGE